MVRAGLAHRSAARSLVHHLKYRGIVVAARVLAVAMARCVPDRTPALIPIPRATARRIRYGVDPARELVRSVSSLTGVPFVDALQPGLWWPRHATRRPEERSRPPFVARCRVPRGAVLVDDVVRTGSTVDAAARVLGVAGLSALAATAPPG